MAEHNVIYTLQEGAKEFELRTTIAPDKLADFMRDVSGRVFIVQLARWGSDWEAVIRLIPGRGLVELQRGLPMLLARIMEQREEILCAFVAKYGCQPDEAEQVQGTLPDGAPCWSVRKREIKQ